MFQLLLVILFCMFLVLLVRIMIPIWVTCGFLAIVMGIVSLFMIVFGVW